MQRLLILTYGVFSYAVFLATSVYAAGFLGNFLVPKSIDAAATLPFWQALLIDLGMLTIFAVQHSVMARPAFKRWWTRFVPEAAERSTYVLFSSLALVLLFALWQPMGGVLWHVDSTLGRGLVYALYACGWLLVLSSSYLINHFDLFGLRQVWLQFRQRPYTPLGFGMPGLYQYVRHPIYVGWLLAFWATPTMTIAHLVFALGTTAYILMAIRWEERDLIAAHGEDYERYREAVPALVPRVARKSDRELPAH